MNQKLLRYGCVLWGLPETGEHKNTANQINLCLCNAEMLTEAAADAEPIMGMTDRYNFHSFILSLSPFLPILLTRF